MNNNKFENPDDFMMKDTKSLYEYNILTGMDLYEFIGKFLPLKPLDKKAQKSIVTGQNIIYLQERSTDRKLRECTTFNLKNTPKGLGLETYKRTTRLNCKENVCHEIEAVMGISSIDNSGDKTRPYSFKFETVNELLQVIKILQNRY